MKKQFVIFACSWILLILVWVWSIKIYVLYLDQQATLAPTSRVNLTPVLFYVLLSGLVILLAFESSWSYVEQVLKESKK